MAKTVLEKREELRTQAMNAICEVLYKLKLTEGDAVVVLEVLRHHYTSEILARKKITPVEATDATP